MVYYSAYTLAPFILDKLKDAVVMHEKQKAIYDKFTLGLTQKQHEDWQLKITTFQEARQRWEKNGHQSKDFPPPDLDPYQYRESSTF
jgi:hypothetical protein